MCVRRWQIGILQSEIYESRKLLGCSVTKKSVLLLMPSGDGQEKLLALRGSGNYIRECLPTRPLPSLLRGCLQQIFGRQSGGKVDMALLPRP